MLEKYFDISEEILSALNEHKPVVALESTVISHGMPYPDNFETALKIESVIRKNDSVPATIAIIDGKIKIGLTNNEIEFIARSNNILKATKRDIPFIFLKKLNAATTVSATMYSAGLAGIKIFATGGIGGVHRHANKTFDISADLLEFTRTEVAVVSAGVKSVLDIGLTLEYLETFSVPVIGFKTNEFPSFFSKKSGFKINNRLDTPQEIADFIKINKEAGFKVGLLIANPIPEEHSINQELINDAIEKAIKIARKNKIYGKEITPFLLSEVNRLTSGKSLSANINLILNNAELAAKISVFL